MDIKNMQTFLVDYSLEKNFTFLDGKRLFKQLLEATQILDVLVNNKKTWSNHPAVKQWRGFEIALFYYIKANWNECKKRGIAKDSQLFFEAEKLITNYVDNLVLGKLENQGSWGDFLDYKHPTWWGREDIISSHRSRLLCKGLVDSYCDALKKKLNIKNLDNWCKENFGRTKNALKYEDTFKLSDLVTQFEAAEHLKPNYYAQFNWADDPSKPYIWPNSIDNTENKI